MGRLAVEEEEELPEVGGDENRIQFMDGSYNLYCSAI